MVLFHILWPVFAMVAVIFTVLVTMAVQRMRHIRATPPTAADVRTGAAWARYFEPVEQPSDNLRNLFETPVLFFAIVPLLMATQQAGIAQVLLAWVFVILRAVHSYIHIVRQDVRARFRMYLASVAVLSAMWIGFFVDFTIAASAYSRAMSNLMQP